jgi:ATP-binding cassette subfamily B multidrug efflux pump
MSTEQNTNKADISLLWRLLGWARPYRSIFALAAGLAVILAPLAVVRPYLINVMIDDYVFKFDVAGMNRILMIIIGTLFIEVGLRYVFIYSTNWLGQSVIRDLRMQVFKHLINLRLKYFDNTPIGTSTTRTISDIETINRIFTEGVITIVADVLTVIAVVSVMLYTSWELTLVCLTVLPLLFIATYIFKEKVKIAFQTVRNQVSVMNAFLQERISGMQVVQIFNAEKQEMSRFKEINRTYTQANLDSILYYAVFFPVVEIISAMALGLMVWFGAREAMIGAGVTAGAMVAFPIYLSMMFRPIRMLADKFNTLQMGLVASERVFNLLDDNSVIANTGKIKAPRLEGKVRFEDVNFAYNLPNYILKNISFNIKPGETLAIVGSTGSGKTTIINILNRFYEIQSGCISIDDVDIKDYELASLRKRIAVVLQDVFLFSGSVYENINLRDDRISKAQVIAAAKLIGAHRFIEKLPGGYDYEVMERGATLSLGQRQLISFVRALVFDPDILILDEATSSIDPETEAVIQYAIEKLIDKRTSIIIAHRLSTIRHANNIMVLDKGNIMEFGPHEELLRMEDGHYRDLYEMQISK